MLPKLANPKILIAFGLSLVLVSALACSAEERQQPAQPAAAAAPQAPVAPAAAMEDKPVEVDLAAAATGAIQLPLHADQTFRQANRAKISRGAPWRGAGCDIFECMPLFLFNEKNQIAPGIALSYDTTDSKVFTVHLDPDAVFHDGTAVTAQDVKDSWEYAHRPEDLSPQQGGQLGPVVGFTEIMTGEADTASGMKVVDANTLEFTLGRSNVLWPLQLTYLYTGMFKLDQAQTDPNWEEHIIGVGPMAYRPDFNTYERLRIPSDNYWRTRPTITKIHNVWVPDEQTHIIMFQNGEIDTTGPTADMYDPASPWNSQLVTGTRIGNYGYFFDVTVAPVDDIKLREAISHALDMPTIVQAVFGFNPPPGKSIVTKLMNCYDPVLNDGYDFDPTRARQALADSSFGSAANLPTIIWAGSRQQDEWVRSTEAAQQMLKEILGIDLAIQMYERGTRFTGTRHMIRDNFNSLPDAQDALTQMAWSAGTLAKDTSKHVDPVVDALWDDAMTFQDLNDPARCEAWQKVLKAYEDGYYYAPIIENNDLRVVQPWVINYKSWGVVPSWNTLLPGYTTDTTEPAFYIADCCGR